MRIIIEVRKNDQIKNKIAHYIININNFTQKIVLQKNQKCLRKVN